MTYLLRSRIDHNIVTGNTPDWGPGQPYDPEEGAKYLEIVHAWQDGSRILLPREMPRRLIPDKSRKNWPDAFMSVNQLLIVGEPVRDILERLDPGLHQFFLSGSRQNEVRTFKAHGSFWLLWLTKTRLLWKCLQCERTRIFQTLYVALTRQKLGIYSSIQIASQVSTCGGRSASKGTFGDLIG